MYKDWIETSAIQFESQPDLSYHKPFFFWGTAILAVSLTELVPRWRWGHYEMLEHLPHHRKLYLLEFYKDIFQESCLPERWRRAIVVPILKPKNDGSSASNYRPITLTSCLCKLFERMINYWLVEFLNLGNLLSNVQCGCRRTRFTLDHLMRLEREVRTAFANNEHFISIFFHLEKAYDMTWLQGILRDLHNTKIRGLLPKFIVFPRVAGLQS